MATKKSGGTARYRALRDIAIPPAEVGGEGWAAIAGDIVELDPDTAALMVRDGMVTPEEA